MGGRLRNMVIDGPKGHGYNQSGSIVIGNGSTTRSSSSCSDWQGPGDCYPFGVEKWYHSGSLVNRDGSQWSGNYLVDYVADALQYETNWPHGFVSGLQPYTYLATKAAASTNPSRPYVDIPVNLVELGDIVKAIRDRGRGIITDAWELITTPRMTRHARNAARTNLAYQFGLAPLVGDLVKLTQFRRMFNQRMAEVEKLQGPTGLRRTLRVDGGSVQFQSGLIYMQSTLASTDSPDIRWDGLTTVDVKAHVRWSIGGGLPNVTPSALMESLVHRSLLGMTLDASTFWELLPWSWLIDWGFGVGDYLKATRNILPATLQGVWISQHSRTEYSQPGRPFAYGEGYLSPGIFVRDTKIRSYSMPVLPTAHIPFLDGRQVGILASLATVRR